MKESFSYEDTEIRIWNSIPQEQLKGTESGEWTVACVIPPADRHGENEKGYVISKHATHTEALARVNESGKHGGHARIFDKDGNLTQI